MKQTLSKFYLCALLVLVSGLPWSAASGQVVKVEADDLTFEEVMSPDIAGNKKGFKPKLWLEIETKIKVAIDPAPKSKTCDRLTVKWYLAVHNPEKSGTYLLMTKEVEHVNIPLDEDVYCSAYLSPASTLRILGKSINPKKAVKFVGFEVICNGKIVANGTNEGDPGWWKIVSPKLALTDVVKLMDKSETPFSNLWWDRYAEVDATKK